MAKLGKSKTVPRRNWRPDFRNLETLPDTKIIRTGFIVNALGLLVALAALAWFGYKEADLQSIAKVVKDIESQVQQATDGDRKSLDLNKKFVQNAEIVSEVIAFDAEAIKYHEFLAEIGNRIPDGMVLTSITMRNSDIPSAETGLPPFHIELIGRVLENTPASPAQMLDNFQSEIKALGVLEDSSVEIDMSKFNRNNDFGYFDFTLLIKITVNKAPAL